MPQFTVHLEPMFSPSRPRVGPVAVPDARKEEKTLALAHFLQAAPCDFKPAFASAQQNQLKGAEDPAARPVKGVVIGMPGERISAPGPDPRETRGRNVKPPLQLAGATGKIDEVISQK